MADPSAPLAGASPPPSRGLQKIPLRLFLLASIWAGLSALGPTVVSLEDDWQHGNPTDWHKLGRMSLACAGMGAFGYIQKHRALLQLPPGFDGGSPE